MRQKLLQLIFLFALLCGGVFLPRTIFAECNKGVDIYIDGETAPSCSGKAIFQETNWTPGDSITKTVELRNFTDKSFNVDLVIAEQPSGILAEKLKITIADFSNSLIYGPKTLQEFFGNSSMAFPNIGPNATNTYKFKIEFPPATNPEDNKYNYNDKTSLHYADGAKCNTIFDLNFGFTKITTTPINPRGGDGPQWFWQNMKPGYILGAMKAATSPIKKFVQAVKLPTKLPRVGAWGALIAASMGLIATVAVHRRNKK